MRQPVSTCRSRLFHAPGTTFQADLPRPLPPVLHPGTRQPIGPADLAPLFPMALIMQAVSRDRYVDIPDEIREIYTLCEKRVILFNLSGHGYFDMSAYEAYQAGKLEDYAFLEHEIEAAMAELPEVQ